MRIQFTKKFKKKSVKLTQSQQKQLEKRLRLFLENPKNSLLNNHKLHGKFSEYRSINITGNIRAVYKIKNEKIFIFYTIGSHSELYS